MQYCIRRHLQTKLKPNTHVFVQLEHSPQIHSITSLQFDDTKTN